MTSRRLAAMNKRILILKAIREEANTSYAAIAARFGVSNRRVSDIALRAGIRRIPRAN